MKSFGKPKRCNKKGITPIIAVILLLMMTVAAAGAAFFWFIRLQSELQGGTEAYQQVLSQKVSAKVDVITARYDGDYLYIYLVNHGNNAVPITATNTTPTTTWILSDPENTVICSGGWYSGTEGATCASGCNEDLKIGEVRKVQLILADPCDDIGDITYGNDTMFSINLDFGGVAGTGAHFLK